MTRLQKKILRQMIDTLRGTINQAKAAIKEEDINKLQSILSACQESAITIGEQIEALEGDGTPAVAALEEYCEKIYETSVAAENGQPLDDYLKAQLDSLNKAEKCLVEKVVKSTVVFMPMDAKWWDGFETLWRKELSTPETTVYVMPIPWYETRFETNEQVRHYDLSAYPEEIGAVSCDSLDLISLHPDVIYIQDATDGTGFGRKVDERFFTRSLRENAEDLTYIPYKIEAEPNIKDRNQLDKLSHSIVVPGLDNVDTVIVQSPNMRNAYINILRRRDHELGIEEPREWAEIVVGSGSPRAERLAKIKREDIVIPEEWKQHVLRPDGSSKKIILYSNSIWLFMNNGKVLVDKLKNSMRVFRDNSDDVALIWRPHPLTEELLQTLRPEYVDEYRNFVKEYKQENYGIYDDEEDFTTSIVLSDAFYGDDGAMVTLYKATGKPIMIENLEIRA